MSIKRAFYNSLLLSFLLASLCVGACKKLIEIPPPTGSITTTETFDDSLDANGAIQGLYSALLSQTDQVAFGNGIMSLFVGSSSDELVPFYTFTDFGQFYRNAILPTSGEGYQIWSEAYNYIYEANACIEGLQASTGLSSAAKSQFTGEAKFVRAFCHFYLVNLFGNVPLITSTNYQTNTLSTRTPVAVVYQQIIADLKDAQSSLAADYSISGGQRTRANSWAATALLARTYLYTDSFASAAAQSSSIISNVGLFSLDTLNGVFLANSTEAILQWGLNTAWPSYNSNPEAAFNLPENNTQPPNYFFLSPQLLAAFEPGDGRYAAWVDSSDYSGTNYYYPFKYKIGTGSSVFAPNAAPTEYYMVLRLAEQYLIRAEAEANGASGGLSAAIADLNSIRARAGGIPLLSPSLTQQQVLAAVAHERQIELFAEWGNRWLDLKRTGQINSVMGLPGGVCAAKGGSWNSDWQFYPIPRNELLSDPNLSQNQGYQ
jgi:hypothetical protein